MTKGQKIVLAVGVVGAVALGIYLVMRATGVGVGEGLGAAIGGGMGDAVRDGALAGARAGAGIGSVNGTVTLGRATLERSS